MSDARTEVLAYLKTNGPSSPRTLLDKIGGTPRALTVLLRTLKAEKQVIAAGTTVNRVYGLPGQRLDIASDTAPARKKRRHAPAKKKRAARKDRRVQRRARREKPVDFLPAITAQNEIVVFNGAAVAKYSAEQSRALADLVFANFTQ